MAIIPSSLNRFKIYSVLIKWEISKSWGMGQWTKYSLYKYEDPSFDFQNHKSKQTTGHRNKHIIFTIDGWRETMTFKLQWSTNMAKTMTDMSAERSHLSEYRGAQRKTPLQISVFCTCTGEQNCTHITNTCRYTQKRD